MPVNAQYSRQNTIDTRFGNQTQRQKKKYQNRKNINAVRSAARQSTDRVNCTKQGAVLLFSAIITGAAVFALTQTVQEKKPEIKEKFTHFQEGETYFNNHICSAKQHLSDKTIEGLIAANNIEKGNNVHQNILIANIKNPGAPSSKLPVHQDINDRTANAMHAVMMPTDELSIKEEECSLSDVRGVPLGFYFAMSRKESFKSFLETCSDDSDLEELHKNFFEYQKKLKFIMGSLMQSERAANSNNHLFSECFEEIYHLFPRSLEKTLQEQGIEMTVTADGLNTDLVKKNGYYQADTSKINHNQLAIADTRSNAKKLLKIFTSRSDIAKQLTMHDMDLAKDIVQMAVRDLSPQTKKQYIKKNLKNNYKILSEHLKKDAMPENQLEIKDEPLRRWGLRDEL